VLLCGLNLAAAAAAAAAVALWMMCCHCCVQALCNSGVVYRELDMLEEAVAAYEDALAVSVGCMPASLAPTGWQEDFRVERDNFTKRTASLGHFQQLSSCQLSFGSMVRQRPLSTWHDFVE
jgi:hypothetical protein